MLKEMFNSLVANAFALGRQPETHIPTSYMPADTSVVSLERYQEAPVRHRFAFSTTRVSDFVDYLSPEAMAGNTVIGIDPDCAGATAIVDAGRQSAPDWGEHKARLDLTKTIEHAALLDVEGRPMKQQQVVEFLEDWGHCITPSIQSGDSDSVFDGSIAQAIQIVRKIEVNQRRESSHEDDDYSARTDGMEAIDMRGRDGQKIVSLKMLAPLYEDTDEHTIDLRLSKSLEGGEPKLKIRIVGYDRLKQLVQQEIENRVREGEGLGECRIFIGHVSNESRS